MLYFNKEGLTEAQVNKGENIVKTMQEHHKSMGRETSARIEKIGEDAIVTFNAQPIDIYDDGAHYIFFIGRRGGAYQYGAGRKRKYVKTAFDLTNKAKSR